MTPEQVEKAARHLCKLRGLDPDEHGNGKSLETIIISKLIDNEVQQAIDLVMKP